MWFQDSLLSVRIPRYLTFSLHSSDMHLFCALSNILILMSDVKILV